MSPSLNCATPDTGPPPSHDGPVSTTFVETAPEKERVYPPVNVMPGYWTSGSMVIDDLDAHTSTFKQASPPSSPTFSTSKILTNPQDNNRFDIRRTIPGRFSGSMYISLDEPAFTDSDQAFSQLNNITPTQSSSAIDPMVSEAQLKATNDVDELQFPLPPNIGSPPQSAIAIDTQWKTPNVTSIQSDAPTTTIGNPIFACGPRSENLKRRHSEDQDDYNNCSGNNNPHSKIRVVIPDQLQVSGETIEFLLKEKNTFQAKYNSLEQTYHNTVSILSSEKDACQKKAHEASQELEKALLQLKSLRKVTSENGEVQLKLEETSRRVDQLLKEKENLEIKMEELLKVNEGLQTGVIERSEEVLIEQEMAQGLLEEKIRDLSDANKDLESRLEEIVLNTLAAKDFALAQISQEKQDLEIKIEEIRKAEQSSSEKLQAYNDLLHYKEDLESQVNDELQQKKGLEAEIDKLAKEKIDLKDEFSKAMRTQQNEHDETLSINERDISEKKAVEELLNSKIALQEILETKLQKVNEEMDEEKKANKFWQKSLEEQLQNAYIKLDDEKDAVMEISRSREALKQSFTEQMNELRKELLQKEQDFKELSCTHGLLQFDINEQSRRLQEAISEKQDALSQLEHERQIFELKLIEKANDSSSEHAAALEELIQAKDAMKLSMRAQEEEINKLTCERDELCTKFQQASLCIREATAAKEHILVQLSNERQNVNDARKEYIAIKNLHHEELKVSDDLRHENGKLHAELLELLASRVSLEEASREKDTSQLRLDTELKKITEALSMKENELIQLLGEKKTLLKEKCQTEQSLSTLETRTLNLTNANMQLQREIEVLQNKVNQAQTFSEEMSQQEHNWKKVATELGLDATSGYADVLRESTQRLKNEQSRAKQMQEGLERSEAELRCAQNVIATTETKTNAIQAFYEEKLREIREQFQHVRNETKGSSEMPPTGGDAEAMDVDENLSERVRSKRPMRSTTPRQQVNQQFKKKGVRFRLGLPDDDDSNDSGTETLYPPNRYRATRRSQNPPSIAQRVRNAYPSPGCSGATPPPSDRFFKQPVSSPTGTVRSDSPFSTWENLPTSPHGVGPSSRPWAKPTPPAPPPPSFCEESSTPGIIPPPLNRPGFRDEPAKEPKSPRFRNPGCADSNFKHYTPTTPPTTPYPAATSSPWRSSPPTTAPSSETPNPSDFSQKFNNKAQSPPNNTRAPRGSSAMPDRSQPSQDASNIPSLEGIMSSINELKNNVLHLKEQNRQLIEERNNSRPETSPFHTPVSTKRQKVIPGSRARPVSRNNLLTLIRKEMNRHWNIQQDSEIPGAVTRGFYTELEVANAFEKGLTDGPSLLSINPCWDTPKCLWNRELARLFARDVIEQGLASDADINSITEYFVNRIITLKKILGRIVPQAGETMADHMRRMDENREQKLSSGRRYQRLTQLFNKRTQICAQKCDNRQSGNWKLLGDMVNCLGVDGQSSDDSDDGEFTVSYLEWRSNQVTQLLDFCDDNRASTTEIGTRRPGLMPRERIRNNNSRPSRRGPKNGLPINFYDQIWYASLGNGTTAQMDVDAQPPICLPIVVTERG